MKRTLIAVAVMLFAVSAYARGGGASGGGHASVSAHATVSAHPVTSAHAVESAHATATPHAVESTPAPRTATPSTSSWSWRSWWYGSRARGDCADDKQPKKDGDTCKAKQ